MSAGGDSAQAEVERNVVYGMYSGLALLTDVYHPEHPNGFGVIYIMGSAWHADLGYDASQLKNEAARPSLGVPALVEAGYTVFAINHRAAPRFRYPAAVQDARRAVRFIRENSDRFGIDGQRIGAAGGSSGAYLALMLGVLDEVEDIDGRGVSLESPRVQAVVGFAPPTDFSAYVSNPAGASSAVISFLGDPYSADLGPESAGAMLYTQASPASHVTADDAPVLLVHGDSDSAVPYDQSLIMRDRLQNAGVEVDLITVRGADHDLGLFEGGEPPSFVLRMIDWFDEHLRGEFVVGD